ncbi:cancer-related nucleoside-triphosphatase isoform X1 [Meleagris gallopavo]|uniref:Nucleoside-triphosphatase, cancer-related n=1 Tax=Meleagris gallopavo TaxID=9103 RepID=A0A803Y9Y9_MELGA|nr:cancer-related nucleoside-triphosphatase isoform X1 [Meleagris gallopavo]XP_019468367.1 cancer-related nucleoside-triphosphatase isoform X1 [Meleagris gallopavo]
MSRHVFLTGPPGIGKTTLIQKVTQALKSSDVPIDGFYTEEVKEGGRRRGFDVVTLSGKRGPLSRVSSDSSASRRECRVGQYVVDVASFEQLVLPVLRNVNQGSDAEKKICVIDEIGKMELFSQAFIQAVRQMLAGSGTVVLGTIPIPKGKPLDLVEEIRSRRDVEVFTLQRNSQKLTTTELPVHWDTCEVSLASISKENRNSILQDILAAVESCRQ